MNDTDYRELLGNALREIKRLRSERETFVQNHSEPIAIVGMACRFPGAPTPEQFWEMSINGKDRITTIPKDRWDPHEYYDPIPGKVGKIVTTQGGFIDNVRSFDAEFFGISPKEARSMDPQQRLLLELTWEALERSAIAPDSLYGKRTGVFLGLSNLEYASLIRQTGDISCIDSHFGTGNSASIAAGRVAYVFGFNGPTMTIDTACSSSLVSIHLATASLRRRECTAAIAGGINLLLLPETFVHFSSARMLANDGRCKPFSAQANGYGRAEGCGIVVLKRLSDAVRDRDPIEALIVGTAINHDGRSAGLTAPNGPAQEAVIQSALEDARLKASDISLIEAHGTGTPLGDPIEAGAIARVYGQGRTEANPVYVATVKANIGHAESAAGVAGLIHACKCLQHRQIPPLLHMDEVSPHIPWKSLRFTKHKIDLPLADPPLRAGISSFGFSGTNAHIIIQEHRNSAATETPPPATWGTHSYPADRTFVLSAKTPSALNQQVIQWIEWLGSHANSPMDSVCYTLQVGRTHFGRRIAFQSNDGSATAQRLKDWLANKPHPINCCNELTTAFLNGEVVDWLSLPRSPSARRLCLPTYAFAQQEFWVSETGNAGETECPVEATVLAEDTLTLTDRDYEDLKDHLVFGASVMPAVAWLEFTKRFALLFYGSAFQLRSIAFSKMLILNRDKPITIDRVLSGVSKSDCEFMLGVSKQTASNGNPPNTRHVSGTISSNQNIQWLGGELSQHRAECILESDVQSVYQQFEGIGLQYGPEFRQLSQLWTGANAALGRLCSSSNELDADAANRFGQMDSALQVVAGAAKSNKFEAQDATAFIPVEIASVQWFDHDAIPGWSLATVRESSSNFAIEADLFVWSDQQQPILQMLGVKFEGFSFASKVPNKLPQVIQSSHPIEQDSSRLTAEKLMAMPGTLRSEILREHLRRQLAEELEIDVEKLLPDRPLVELGLDSLMVFRMGIKMESEFGFGMDSQAFIQGISLQKLTDSLLWKLEDLHTKGESNFGQHEDQQS